MAKFYLLALLAVIVSIITLASFMKFQRYAFYNKTENNHKEIKEVPFPMKFSMIIMSLLCIVLSLLAFPGIRDVILMPAIDILTDPVKYSSFIIGN